MLKTWLSEQQRRCFSKPVMFKEMENGERSETNHCCEYVDVPGRLSADVGAWSKRVYITSKCFAFLHCPSCTADSVLSRRWFVFSLMVTWPAHSSQHNDTCCEVQSIKWAAALHPNFMVKSVLGFLQTQTKHPLTDQQTTSWDVFAVTSMLLHLCISHSCLFYVPNLPTILHRSMD